jgi:uncharacterized protein (TIGR03437 family)
MRLLLLLAGLGTLGAQTLTNTSLAGRYFFVALEVTAAGARVTGARNLAGTITFDGAGGYAYNGKLGVGSAAATPASGSGRYALGAAGDITLTNPLRTGLEVRAHLGAEGVALLGSTTEGPADAYDLFIAVRAPTGTVGNAILNGSYTGATFQLPSGGPGMRSAIMALAANGAGQFTQANVTGHGSELAGVTQNQQAVGATYAIGGDGSGTASFGSGARLLSGARDIFVSSGGDFILGYSAEGARDIFLAARNFARPAEGGNFAGRYWMAELFFDGTGLSSAIGSMAADGVFRLLISQRVHLPSGNLDFSGVNFFAVRSDGFGVLRPESGPATPNMALGTALESGGRAWAGSVVGAEVGTLATATQAAPFGVFLAVRAPVATGTGVFLDPAGVVNGASFAPLPHPIAPGQIVSLFGSGLAPGTASAESLPLPTTLLGVSVTVNEQPAPLFWVSPGQVNIQAPFGLAGATARIRVTNGGTPSNEVTAPLAPTGPGVFSFQDARSPTRAVVLHSDLTPVTTDRPALPGQTVVIFLTGLGALDPPVATGAGNPSVPGPARAVDTRVAVLFNQTVGRLRFAGGAPGFAGLNQINATIPDNVSGGISVPLAIATSSAYTDIVDMPIATFGTPRAAALVEGVSTVAIPPRARVSR